MSICWSVVHDFRNKRLLTNLGGRSWRQISFNSKNNRRLLLISDSTSISHNVCMFIGFTKKLSKDLYFYFTIFSRYSWYPHSNSISISHNVHLSFSENFSLTSFPLLVTKQMVFDIIKQLKYPISMFFEQQLHVI